MSMIGITAMRVFDSCGILLSVRFGVVNLYGEGAGSDFLSLGTHSLRCIYLDLGSPASS